jgi:hypothetical protein
VIHLQRVSLQHNPTCGVAPKLIRFELARRWLDTVRPVARWAGGRSVAACLLYGRFVEAEAYRFLGNVIDPLEKWTSSSTCLSIHQP